MDGSPILNPQKARMYTELERKLAIELIAANDLLRTCHFVVAREGRSTAWSRLLPKLKDALQRQHDLIYPGDKRSPTAV